MAEMNVPRHKALRRLALGVAAVLMAAFGILAALHVSSQMEAAVPTTTGTQPPSSTEPVVPPSPAPHPTPVPPAAPAPPLHPEPPTRLPPPPAPSEPSPRGSDVDAAVARLKPARVAFNVPRTIGKGDVADIELRLSLTKPLRRLQQELTEIGRREGATIKVADRVKARLSGAGFSITAVSDEEQLVTSLMDTHWEWQVEGSEAGDHELNLTLTSVVDVGGDRSSHEIESYQHTIHVRVTVGQRIDEFVDQNWQWFLSAILIPLAGFGWTAWRRRAGTTPSAAAPQ